jgi:hypothetical protein
MQTQIFKGLIIMTLTTTLMACGKGFNAATESSDSNSGLGTVTDPTTGSPVSSEKAWSDVSSGVNGRVEGGSNDGSLVIQIDKARQALVLILPLPPIFLLSVSGAPIPELPGASFEMIPQADGSNAMGIVIPLKYVIKGGQFADYGRLPNGDPIPFIPVGEAHGFAISFPQKPSYRLHLYLAVNAAAVFIETPDWKLPDEFSMIPTIGFPVKNQDKTRINGYFAIVPNRGNYSSGVYVASRIPSHLAVMIDELLRF